MLLIILIAFLIFMLLIGGFYLLFYKSIKKFKRIVKSFKYDLIPDLIEKKSKIFIDFLHAAIQLNDLKAFEIVSHTIPANDLSSMYENLSKIVIRKNSESILNFMLDNGLEVSHKLLKFSIHRKRFEIAGKLLERDFNINDHQEESVIFYCLKKELYQFIPLFLEKGIDLNHKDLKGLTPIHWAYENKKFEQLELLLKEDFDPKLITNNKESYLDLAIENNDLEYVEKFFIKNAVLFLNKKRSPFEISFGKNDKKNYLYQCGDFYIIQNHDFSKRKNPIEFRKIIINTNELDERLIEKFFTFLIEYPIHLKDIPVEIIGDMKVLSKNHQNFIQNNFNHVKLC